MALVAELEELEATACADCGAEVCGHDYVVCAAMGFKDRPRCRTCLAAALGRNLEDFSTHVLAYVADRYCFRTAWHFATEQEQGGCAQGNATDLDGEKSSRSATPQVAGPAEAFAAEWDAGDMSCGDLVLQLRIRLNRLTGGEVLKLRATDPAAPEDIPAWCRLTGHGLESARHPHYWIRRKD